VGSETRSPGKRARARLGASDQGGQALVEFALILPALLMILTGIFITAIAFTNYIELTNAVAVGAEALAISRCPVSANCPASLTNPCSNATGLIADAAPLLSPSNISYTIVLTPIGGTGTPYGSSCTQANLSTGELATVTAFYPCNLSFYNFIAPNCKLEAQVTEFIQ
jgi:hypothetical protein